MDKELISIDGPGPLKPIGEPKPAKPPIDWTRPVQIRQGLRVRIYAIDHNMKRPVIGSYEGDTRVLDWHYDGSFGVRPDEETCLDLENVPTTQSEAL